jgi:benzoylformate decarboxylase
MYTIQGLWTAAHHDVGAIFVICNNHSYELLKVNIREYWRERGIPEHTVPDSFNLTGPDIRFDLLAQALGVAAVRVEKPEQVRPAIEAALAHRGPFLIDLVMANQVASTRAIAAGNRA